MVEGGVTGSTSRSVIEGGYMVKDGQMQYGKRGRPIRRCPAVAPVHGNQCEKRRKHNKTDNRVAVHKAGSLIWCDNGRHEHFGEGQLKERTAKLLGRGVRLQDKALLGGGTVGQGKPIFSFNTDQLLDKRDTMSFGITRDEAFDMETLGKEFIARLRENFRRQDEQEMTTSGDTGRLFGTKAHEAMEDASPAARARAAGRAAPIPLDTWWRQVSEREISDTVPKAIEYGATDLIDIGTQLGKWMKRGITDAEAAELGCWFYLIGKMARATSAIDRGDFPSNDTIKDVGIYVKMIQRIRQAGSWPGEELSPDDE